MDDRADDGTGPSVVRSEFFTTDADEAEQFLNDGYTTANRITIDGVAEDFTLTQSAVTAPGLSVNRMQIGVDVTDDACAGPDDPITAIHVLGGRLAYVDTAYPDVHAEVGDVLMLPLTGPVTGIGEHVDLAMVQLDRPAVVAYAAATTGIDADRLAFDGITPLAPGSGRYWVEAMAHVRDHVLSDPWAAGQPIVLDQAFRTLAAALLSTMPNSALARATDPEAAPVRGDVPAARLREVVDYLDTHADRPIGPVDVAELAGMPTAEIVEGLRRRCGVHPAGLLWQARLRGVHRDLLDTDPHTTVPVARIAARWGFDRTGRFRVAYQRAFDETPEHTLRR